MTMMIVRHTSGSCYLLTIAGTHCNFPWNSDEAELTSVVAYIPRWFARLTCLRLPVLLICDR